MPDVRLLGPPQPIDNLTSAVLRLAAAVESMRKGLGGRPEPRYTPSPENAELLDEKNMAQVLDIPARTLGKFRRQGRFPNCWIRNGKRIRWHAVETQEIWKRGIA